MERQSFNQAWHFYLGDPFSMGRKIVPLSEWRVLDLPHDWSIELDRTPDSPSGVSNGWFPMGRGWYAKSFMAPEFWRGKKVLIEFEGIYMNAEVWLNRNFLGRHPYGYTTFVMDLTPYLRIGEENNLLVKVENSAQTNSRWYSGSGIYRPVWLYVAGPIHVAHWGIGITTPEVSQERALIRAEVHLENDSETMCTAVLGTSVLDPGGLVVAKGTREVTIEPGRTAAVVEEFVIANPQRWSPETPRLYELQATVRQGEQVVDVESAQFGIRSLRWSAERGFLLNDEPILLRGGCVHHDNGVLGAASYPQSEARKVAQLKASGFNAVRCAHNPPAPAFLDACDRLGMLVIDEAFDCWREGKTPFDYHMVFDDWWARDIESMVLRDRNHPSIVMWSIGNEVTERDGRSGGAQIARMLADAVRKLDPSRPITSAICGVWDELRTWEDTDVVFAALDIGGYNYQWERYESDHARHPERLMVGTESFPLEALENWMQVEQHSWVIGDFVWTALDYLGESGIGRQHTEGEKGNFLGEFPWHQAYCGDLDLCYFKRPQSYFRDQVWGVGDPLYIAVHYPVPEGKTPTVTRWGWPDVDASWTWPGHEGETFKVDVYSRCERVELFLNERSLGVKPTTRAEKLTASFEVPYEPGTLRAVGYVDDKVVAEKTLETTGSPYGVRLTLEQPALSTAPADLWFVQVEVVDAEGHMVPYADDEVFFTVKGPGTIAAVGSANPATLERYRGNQRRVFRGRCLVVVKSSGDAGEITLRAQADGLEDATLVIPVG